MAERPAVRVTGREPELALLTAAVADLRAGRGRAVLIEGEAGIGKSALLAGVLADVDTTRCRVLLAACDELTQRFPLSAITQALDPATWPGAGTAQAAPEAARLGMLPGDPVLGAVEELLGVIHRMCAERPLVLALEDMHWADEASVLLWRRLCRVTTQIPLLLVGTRRPLPRGAPLERDVRASGGIVILLDRLPAAGVTQMAADLAGGVPGPRLLGWLEPAAGNPFYVRELLDAALRSGAVREFGGQLELADPDEPLGQVTSLRQAVVNRLDFLSPEALQVLRIASLLGPEFPVTDLAAVTGQTPADLLPVVEDAIAGGLLEEAGTQLRFRHGLLQQALYEGMPAPLRAGLHRQAAQSLIELRAPADRIARHLLALPVLGEEWEAQWLATNAADLAGRVPEVAATLLGHARASLPRYDARRAGLEDHLTDALFGLGRYEEVERLTAAILPHVTDADRYGHLTWIRAYALLRARRRDEMAAVLEAATARPDVTEVWRTRFLALRTMMRNEADPGREAVRAADAVLAAATRLGDPTALAYARQARITQHFLAHEFAAAVTLIDQALPLTAADPQLTDLRLIMIHNRVGLTGELGHFDEAWTLARETLTSYELSGSPRLGPLRLNAAGLAYDLGHWDEAVAELDALTETEDRNSEIHGIRALIAGHRDDWPLAVQHLAALHDGGGEQNVPDPRVNDVMALAIGSERNGDLDQAVSLLADWLDPARAQQLPFQYKLLPALVRLALAVGDEATARAAARDAHREVDQEPRARRQAMADWCDGLVAADPAAVRAAAQVLAGLGVPLEAGNALEDAAVGFAQAGETGIARSVLDEALAGYEQLGAAWDARRAAARIRPHGIRPSVRNLRQRPQTGWQSLTSTETQVAQLLAEGRSNPDIAAQLFISRRTVESHVSHILAKLQLTSRWEVKAKAE